MKRSTVILLVIFLALVGLMLYLNQKEPAPSEEEIETATTEPVEFLFSESDGLPASIDIQDRDGNRVVIARNEDGLWVLEMPIEADADQGSAQAAASQLTSLRILSTVEVAPVDVGLEQPSYTLSVKLTGGTQKTVRIGDLTPTGSGYYANVGEDEKVLILSKVGLDALITLLDSPPYLEEISTETP